jgi:hypothetical protein
MDPISDEEEPRRTAEPGCASSEIVGPAVNTPHSGAVRFSADWSALQNANRLLRTTATPVAADFSLTAAPWPHRIDRTEGCEGWREAYFTADTNEPVSVLECGGADEARIHLGNLPLVKAGLIDFKIMPLTPYPGFARLFVERS